MNWGWKIAVVYSAFVVGMLSMVVTASRQTNDLVSEDYYARELAYQDRIDARANSQSLPAPMQFEWLSGQKQLQLQFPAAAAMNTATLHLYRPSDASQDRKFSLQGNADTLASVDLSQLSAGFWRVQLDWESGGRAYFKETTLVVP
ncbi:MAG: hypothetical protein GC205_11245 [Bacteroidetes bacterium]|nr:hypothetical protein [Bacteroidota bacterium]